MIQRVRLLASVALFLFAARAHAQTQVQVKPWFLVIVDTSGSMTSCTNGATDSPTCVTCTGGCVSTANSCGTPHTRISDARCALKNILNSTGDAEFALMQFHHACRATCDDRSGGDSSTCDADLSVPLATSNYSLLTWVDGACQGSCANGGMTSEIYSYGNTPIGKSLDRAKQYFTGTLANTTSPTATDPYAGCRPVAVIILTDGDETCGGAPATSTTALRSSVVPGPNGNLTIDIKTYAVGFGLTPGNANMEGIATAGGTDAPGNYRAFYAQDEESLSSALNLIITNSQLAERCDGIDNDCDTRIDEDFAKYCDVRGVRTSNPLVPNPANTSMTIDQSLVDSRVPACSNGVCPPVNGIENNIACAAPEWASSSMCSPANTLCTSPGEICDGRDDDCDGRIDENATPNPNVSEICGDNLDNDCDSSIDEGCNGCVPQPEICNGVSDDCDTNIDEGLTRTCGTDQGVCTAGTETCMNGSWVGCTATTGTAETCNNKDDDCDGVVDGLTMSCGMSAIGLCRMGVRTCINGAYGACAGEVDPAPELCDGLDNDCDADPNDDGANDSRVGKACGNTLGTCHAGMTVCDHGEIKCVGGTNGTSELCNGLDDDCDGRIDEGVAGTDVRVSQPCVAPGGVVSIGPVMVTGQCRLGTSVCANGVLTCPGYIGATPELCDALDQDCDGNPVNGVALTDPRVGAGCGTSVGECDPGQIQCVNGALVCSAAAPGVESCNGLDDDCDGATDEKLPASPMSCDTTNHGNVGQCKVGQQACIRGALVCAGEVTPTPEICNGLDDDCDNEIDEDVADAGRLCGSATGTCHTGVSACVGGVLTCPGSTAPGVERCDGLDNDCDGLTDEGNPDGGGSCDTDAQGTKIITDCRTSADPDNQTLPFDQPCGECRFGVQVCQGAKLVCLGGIGTKPEVCDGLDNDCDSPCVIDNHDPAHPVRKCPTALCNKPKSDPQYVDCLGNIDEDVEATDPNVGVVCVGGSGECKQGTEQCVDGTLTCVGGQIPVAELCNDKDDDCDTLIDEGFALGTACGVQVGECQQGVWMCDPQTGQAVCRGQKEPSTEVCDGLDNDCDGVIDNGNPGGGGACGSSQGTCQPGVLQCIAGKLRCAGENGPQPEVCDCQDNDCDGNVDEDPSPGSSICPGSGQCAMCQCAQPCRMTVEFSVGCPTGKTGVTVDGQCLCVGELCNAQTCAAETLKDGDTVLCTPGSKSAGTCVCRNNQCVSRCDGVTCSGGLVCDTTTGTCQERSCLLPQFACKAGEFCDITQLGCAPDPCAGVQCASDQACRDGTCFGSCATKVCAAGERCHDGECSPDKCAGVTCPAGVCDSSSGECVALGTCGSTGCRPGYVCDRVAGVCSPDPCLRTTCPDNQICMDGECAPRCAAPLILCGDTCINPSNSRDHCGASGDCAGSREGTACNAAQVCSAGSCTDTCKTGEIECEGGCVDPDSDPLHCGASATCRGLEAGIACPSGTICRGGMCLTQTTGSRDTSQPESDKRRVTVTGGGGCSCDVPAGHASPPQRWAALMLLGLLVLARARRRRQLPRFAAVGLALLLSFMLGGCKVNPLCLNCRDDSPLDASQIGGGDFNNPDSAVTQRKDSGSSVPDANAGTRDAGSATKTDAGARCVDTEVCNGIDDDCDGKIDEGVDPGSLGIDTQTDVLNCGVCGHRCALDHAFGKCVAGQCHIDSCDPEYVDVDQREEDGCEYRCTKVEDDDAVCDHRDDDCDGKIDENVDLSSDKTNCGSCGNTCDAPNAQGVCDNGVCKLDNGKCNSGFVDADGVFANGCEYQCTPRPDGLELCNNVDDDCDRRIDENVFDSDVRLGVTCGAAVGACSAGMQGCVGGAVVCQGGHGPQTEICNGTDDDCDGNTDESFPQRGLPCGTDLGECTRGTEQCAAGVLVCIGGTGSSGEICDGKDNDCDGKVDETNATDGPPMDVGRRCKTQSGVLVFDPPAVLGECRLGVAQCVTGHMVCAGEVGPQPELCDALDQDCDGMPLNGVTMTDPVLGSACGTDVGECSFGTIRCLNGMRTCDNSGGKLPAPEICNGKDDDCDGNYDEVDAKTNAKPIGAGEPCLIDASGAVQHGASVSVQGECKLGTSTCSGGFVACPDFVGPTPERCDALDQDCDGNPLNGVASSDDRIGVTCAGNNIGACRSGTQDCNAGAIACQGVVMPGPELCNGIDDNCDGSVLDDGVNEPMLGMPCGSNVGSCHAGTLQCMGGSMLCVGQVGAAAESCDGADNDCDGMIDEDFQLQTNTNRCGSCGNACSFANATPKCVGGTCQIASCAPGYHDSAAQAGPDCNVGPCTIAGNEICNGVDDDCNGLIDDALTTPTLLCNTVGACAGATASCQGVSGWVCSKLPAAERCNGADDNCNGQTDEGFPIGQSCAAPGIGACATSGTLRCTNDGSSTQCVNGMNVPVTTGTAGQEICNGVDDDCDGTVDEPCGGADTNCVSDAWVSLGAGVEIYQYEASRPDATASTAGALTARACSASNRLPWTNLTYQQARAACAAADSHARLCTEAEWEQACMDDAGGSTCTWAFPDYPACNAWSADQCNGFDYSASPGVQASGHSGARNACFRGATNDTAGQIWELTGNVKEYVLQRGTGAIPVRGGANNNTQDGLRCDFDFPVWPYGSAFTNVGFRCCRSSTALPTQCGTLQNTGLSLTGTSLVENTISSEITGTITDVNVVNLKGSHAAVIQLNEIDLVGPDGTSIQLTNTGYCSGKKNWSYVFDSDGATALPPTAATPCGSGSTFRPAQALTAFNGKSAFGTWKIQIRDNTPASSNPTLTSWGLQLCVNPN